MVEMLKETRKIVRRGDKLIFIVYQEQEYTEELRQNLLKIWRKDLAEKRAWIKDFESHIKSAEDAAVKQLKIMKTQVEKDIIDIEEGVRIWENVEDEK